MLAWCQFWGKNAQIQTILNEVKMENNKSEKAEAQKAKVEKAETRQVMNLVELTSTIMDLQDRVYSLEDKLQDLIDNLRIFIRKDEEENGK